MPEAAGHWLDEAALQAMSGGLEWLRAKVLQLFVQGAPGDLDRLRAALASGDCEAIAAASHRLLGTARTIGAGPLAARCSMLNRSAREGRSEGEALEPIEQAVAATIAAAEEQLGAA